MVIVEQQLNYSVNVPKNLHLNETKTRTQKKCTAYGLAMMSFVSPLPLGGHIGVATLDMVHRPMKLNVCIRPVFYKRNKQVMKYCKEVSFYLFFNLCHMLHLLLKF